MHKRVKCRIKIYSSLALLDPYKMDRKCEKVPVVCLSAETWSLAVAMGNTYVRKRKGEKAVFKQLSLVSLLRA